MKRKKRTKKLIRSKFQCIEIKKLDDKYFFDFKNLLEVLKINELSMGRILEKLESRESGTQVRKSLDVEEYDTFKSYVLFLYKFGLSKTQITYLLSNTITKNTVDNIIKSFSIVNVPQKPIDVHLIYWEGAEAKCQNNFKKSINWSDLFNLEMVIVRLNTKNRITLKKAMELKNVIRNPCREAC